MSKLMICSFKFVILSLAYLYFLHIKIFQKIQKSPQLGFMFIIYASYRLTYLVNHHVTKWMPHHIRLLTYVEIATSGLSRRLQRVQNPNSNWELWHAKNLDAYQEIFKTELQEGSSPHVVMVFGSIIGQCKGVRHQDLKQRTMLQPIIGHSGYLLHSKPLFLSILHYKSKSKRARHDPYFLEFSPQQDSLVYILCSKC